jgi:hypothetical protein
MKNIGILIVVFTTTIAFGQTQIPNSNFENIFTATGTNPSGLAISYDSLNGGWTSGNPVKRYIPIDDSSTTYQFMMDTNYTWNASSQHAIVMRSFKIGPILATGNLGTGAFNFNSVNPFASAVFGTAFADRPISMIGYYQYKSVLGDTCRIEVILSKWNTVLSKRDTVGYGVLFDNSTFNNFKQFSIPINYNNSDTPDSCSIICMSSAYGLPASSSDAPRGQVGSTLIVDDFSMIYNTNGLTDQDLAACKVYANGKNIVVEFPKKTENTSIQLIDLSGKILYNASVEKEKEIIPVSTNGVVIVKISSNDAQSEHKIYIK